MRGSAISVYALDKNSHLNGDMTHQSLIGYKLWMTAERLEQRLQVQVRCVVPSNDEKICKIFSLVWLKFQKCKCNSNFFYNPLESGS